MDQVREYAVVSLKATYRPGKGGGPLPCNLETKFLRLDQSTSNLLPPQPLFSLYKLVMEKAIVQWITEGSHLEVLQGKPMNVIDKVF